MGNPIIREKTNTNTPVRFYLIVHYFYSNANILYTSKEMAEKRIEELCEQTGSSRYEWNILMIPEGNRFDISSRWIQS